MLKTKLIALGVLSLLAGQVLADPSSDNDVTSAAYRDYTIKSKLSKVASNLDTFKVTIAMYYMENGKYPDQADAWSDLGFTQALVNPAEISSLHLRAGTGQLVFVLANIDPGVDGSTVTATPVASDTSMSWTYTCSSKHPIVKKYFNC
jgi:type IV pilus assembly protein PilA